MAAALCATRLDFRQETSCGIYYPSNTWCHLCSYAIPKGRDLLTAPMDQETREAGGTPETLSIFKSTKSEVKTVDYQS